MRGRSFAAIVVALAALPLIPGLDTDFGRSLLTQMAIAAVFALSFNLLFGQTGLLSFGHAVYFGLGGYAAPNAMPAARKASRQAARARAWISGSISGRSSLSTTSPPHGPSPPRC